MRTASHLLRILLLVIVIGLMLAPSGRADAILWCRGDPVVVLSNGMVMDIGASVATSIFRVETIHYELHAPVGVSLVAAVGTPGLVTLLGLPKETFTFYADQPPGQYMVVTTVQTRGNADVIADTTLLSPSGLRLSFHTTPGRNGEAITLILHE